jgi:hypothetical protein
VGGKRCGCHSEVARGVAWVQLMNEGCGAMAEVTVNPARA